MGKLAKYLVPLLALVMVAALTLSCAAPAPVQQEPGQKEKPNTTVLLSYFGDASGPYASLTGPVMDGVMDFIKWSNETNYIPGVTLEVKMYDHGLNIGRATAMSKEAFTATPKPVLSNGGQVVLFNPVFKKAGEQYKIPVFDSASLETLCEPPGWYFGTQPSYEGQLGAYADWVMKNWKPDSEVRWIREHYQNRTPRMTLVSYDNQPIIETPICYMKSKYGIELNIEKIPLAGSDITPQLSRMKGNTDFVAEYALAPSWIACLKKAKELDMADQFIAVGHTAVDINAIAKALPNQANNNGGVGVSVRFFEELPKQVQDAQIGRKFSKDTMGYSSGWYWGDIAAQIIRKTTAAVGVEKIDGETCYKTLCDGAIKDFTPIAGTSSITWSNNATLVKMEGCNQLRLDLIEGWDGKSMDTLSQSIKKWDLPIPSLMLPNGKDIPAGCK